MKFHTINREVRRLLRRHKIYIRTRRSQRGFALLTPGTAMAGEGIFASDTTSRGPAISDLSSYLAVKLPASIRGPGAGLSMPGIAWVNVTDVQYANGADPTGVKDSTAAINAAIASLPTTGSVLYFPPGTYIVSAVLTALPTNCLVLGAGQYVTTISANIASGSLFSVGTTNTIQWMTLQNTNVLNVATAITLAASQPTVISLTCLGWGISLSFTSAATNGNVIDAYLSSTLAGSIGLVIAGSDTMIAGIQLVSSGQMIGIQCAANDRFSISDPIFKTCLIGLQMTNTSVTGSTAVSSPTFDNCTTAISITPGTGQSVQNVAMTGITLDGASTSTGIAISPTGSGTVSNVDLDGIINGPLVGINVSPTGTATVTDVAYEGELIGSATGQGILFGGSSTGLTSLLDFDVEITNYVTAIAFNHSAGAVQATTINARFSLPTAASVGIQLAPTATGTISDLVIADGIILSTVAALPITLNGPANSLFRIIIAKMIFDAPSIAITVTAGLANIGALLIDACNFQASNQAISPLAGSANNLNYIMRGCFGLNANPIGKLTSQPALPASGVAVTNNTGVDCDVWVTGGTVTAYSIGGASVGIGAAGTFPIPLPSGQTLALTYTVAPTDFTWVGR